MLARPISKNTLEIYALVSSLGSDGKLFKVSDIVEELGLSRTLVSNKLSYLVSLGFLTHYKTRYAVNDMAAFNSWAWTIQQKDNKNKKQRIQEVDSVLYGETVLNIKRVSNAVLYGQKIKLNNFQEVKMVWIKQLDRAIMELKRERKFVMGHTKPFINEDLTNDAEIINTEFLKLKEEEDD